LIYWAFSPSVAEAADAYDVISEKNLFRPDRKAWEEPKEDDDDPLRRASKPRKPIELQLYGTIIVGDRKCALIRDPKQKGQGREMYSVGEYIGDDYVLTGVSEKMVALDYYGEKVTLHLHEDKGKRISQKTALPSAPRPAQKAKRPPKRQPRKPKGYKRPDPFMSREEIKETVQKNQQLMEEMQEAGALESLEDAEEVSRKILEEMRSMLEEELL
jgi:hypothetical protein